MRKWLATAVALSAVLLFGSTAWSASDMVVSGVINNWKEVRARVPASAYLQLVKMQEKMKGITDAQGLAAYDSKFPKISVSPNGSFRVDIKGLPPGDYIIALQHAVPPGASGTPFLGKEEKVLVIKIPGEFPLDVGKVEVAVFIPK